MGITLKTYSDQMCDWLVELGYTHCFFVAGGNIMHLLNSARERFTCIPVVHEVTAGIAAEYFEEIDLNDSAKAFALVTAGPGLTNIVTAMAGAHMESRSLLVIGGQVKSSDLTDGSIRQRGIQEISGVRLVESICKAALQISSPIAKSEFVRTVALASTPRKGVVFLEACLDAQGAPADVALNDNMAVATEHTPLVEQNSIDAVADLINNSQRPVILLGGGVSRVAARKLLPELSELGIPLMTTWNAADRIPSDLSLNWGRPNTWGMRHSNVLIQQADVIVAIGTRLGLQQTGFNWQEFAPLAKVVQVDIDESELVKGHPNIHLGLCADADLVLKNLVKSVSPKSDIDAWLELGQSAKSGLPLSDNGNNSFDGYWNPYEFMMLLTREMANGDSLVPSSSGAAETVAMQSASICNGAFAITDKGMASMGYGLAGAIGAAFKTKQRVIHIEGDGGFAQNLQELGTVRINNLPIKTFIFDNGGYASIRMTQRSYFNGEFVGVDKDSGLGLPDWVKLFESFGISCYVIEPTEKFDSAFLNLLRDEEPRAFLVPIHPDQTYYPKITSRVLPDGKMVSNPLHFMTPELTDHQIRRFLPYLIDRLYPLSSKG